MCLLFTLWRMNKISINQSTYLYYISILQTHGPYTCTYYFFKLIKKCISFSGKTSSINLDSNQGRQIAGLNALPLSYRSVRQFFTAIVSVSLQSTVIIIIIVIIIKHHKIRLL